ncbi:MAG: nucleoside monophosphate kinase, partial [Candidatus Aminicenantes bacterium]|nr:nucleoside monophosphate kinase [Candidatus Aminicenantes bacterium]
GMDSKRMEAVADIQVEDERLVERLSARRVCSCGAVFHTINRRPRVEETCDVCGGRLIRREDDRPEVMRERLRVYHDLTEPLIVFYRNKGNYFSIDGEADVQTVFSAIFSKLKERIAEN